MKRGTLLPGDRVVYRSATGLKLRATVVDYIPMKGDDFVAVQKRTKVVWFHRNKLRKLPCTK